MSYRPTRMIKIKLIALQKQTLLSQEYDSEFKVQLHICFNPLIHIKIMNTSTQHIIYIVV